VHIEPLSRSHDKARKAFDCGKEPLNRYLREQAGQDAKARVAATFVFVDDAKGRVAGYYTLSSLSVKACDLPAEAQRKLPRYPDVPVTLLGRLAIDTDYQGHRHGEYLLLDALQRSLTTSRSIASFAVLVDAKDDGARGFYERYGFMQFPDQPLWLFLPMTTIEQLKLG